MQGLCIEAVIISLVFLTFIKINSFRLGAAFSLFSYTKKHVDKTRESSNFFIEVSYNIASLPIFADTNLKFMLENYFNAF